MKPFPDLLATEAAGAMTRLAFEAGGGKRVEARIDERNSRSAVVAERLGYELEGTLKSHRRNNQGRLSGTLIYAITDLIVRVLVCAHNFIPAYSCLQTKDRAK